MNAPKQSQSQAAKNQTESGLSSALPPLPTQQERGMPFWQAAKQGKLRIQACLDCASHRFPDAPVCAHCLSTNAHWVDVSPIAVVKAWCRFHRAYFRGFHMPHTVLLIELEGGARMYANLASGHEDITPYVGMKLHAEFEDIAPEVTMPKFRPA